MTRKTSPAYRASKEETIPINKLHPFSNHPFHIRHDLEFSELVDSISESGIITPIIVRPKVGVGYEVISGHRRWEACKELGIESIPARVEYIDDDEATILMVNSNIQREHVLPSEKAFAYKMRMEAMKHQGKATSSQLGTKLRTLDAMGKEVDESRNQIHRYIRLTYLIPSILQMVDDGRIAFNPAVEISYMTEEHQTWLKEEMDMCDATPSLVQSRTLKDMSRNGTLTENYLHTLLTEEKPNQRQKFFLNQSDVQQYFPSSYTPQQMQNGQYLVVETTIPKDVFQCDPFIVTVSKDSPQSRFTVPAGSVTTATNNYMAYNVLDEELEGYLQLVKTDTETGKAVKIANTAFALYKLDDKGNKTRISMIDPASGSATKKTDVFYTDADGLMKTPEKLPLGRYLIEELQGPEGYYNDPAYSVEFEITSERVWQVVGNATNDMDEYIVEEKYFNHETLGQLTIRKLGNVLTDYKDGQFIYTQDNLAGATYEIHADGDIATLDRQGTYWYKDGDLVATVTTGAAGQVDEVKFAPNRTQATYDFLTISHDGTKGEVTVTLPLGKYTITEVKAPYGFVLTQQSYSVEFGWDNQRNDIVLAKTIVSHEQDGDKECSYALVAGSIDYDW